MPKIKEVSTKSKGLTEIPSVCSGNNAIVPDNICF